EEEVTKLFKAAEDEPFHWRVFITLALAAGLRRSELLALEWKHIDLEKGMISIEQALVRGLNSKPVLKNTKTETSYRIVSIPESVIDELKEYRLYWKKELFKIRDIRQTTEDRKSVV